MKIKYKNKSIKLEPGDRIVVPITLLSITQHHAIYYGQINGIHYFIENKNGFGVRLITAEQFIIENPSITRIQKFPGDAYDRTYAIQKAYKLLGKKYDLLGYNCEHFANDIQHSVNTSPQVKVGIALGIFTLLILVIRSE
jgi:hypothetical protein